MDEYQIVYRVKDWYREGELAYYYLLLNGNRISFVTPPSFHESNKQGQISDLTIGSVYLIGTIHNPITWFEFPMFSNIEDIVQLYIYKRGSVLANEPYGRYPLPNLKYYICGVRYENKLAVELVDLDVVANNLNLSKIVSWLLGPKLLRENNMIDDYMFNKIVDQTRSQKLFAGHTLDDADDIAYQYFDKNKRKLSKEVLKISQAYERVFRPYRVVYDTKTWEPAWI